MQKIIIEEIERQQERMRREIGAFSGKRNHSPVEWISILGTEFGMASRAASQFQFPNSLSLHALDMYDEVMLIKYREALIRILAISFFMIDSLDRGEGQAKSRYSWRYQDIYQKITEIPPKNEE